jgi:dephospho-CoA kinase
MKIVGITGGIGTGKSMVAKMLRERGWVVYSSDDTGREIMDTDPDVRRALQDLFGPAVVSDDGSLDRRRIASMVFGPSDEARTRLDALDRLIHPRVLDRHWQLLEQHEQDGTPLVAIETALLYEVGLEDGFDHVIVVDADDDVRIARTMERSGMSRQEVIDRMARQLPAKEKRGWADVVIDNNGSLDDLQRAVNMAALVIEALPDPKDRTDDDVS